MICSNCLLDTVWGVSIGNYLDHLGMSLIVLKQEDLPTVGGTIL